MGNRNHVFTNVIGQVEGLRKYFGYPLVVSIVRDKSKIYRFKTFNATVHLTNCVQMCIEFS